MSEQDAGDAEAATTTARESWGEGSSAREDGWEVAGQSREHAPQPEGLAETPPPAPEEEWEEAKEPATTAGDKLQGEAAAAGGGADDDWPDWTTGRRRGDNSRGAGVTGWAGSEDDDEDAWRKIAAAEEAERKPPLAAASAAAAGGAEQTWAEAADYWHSAAAAEDYARTVALTAANTAANANPAAADGDSGDHPWRGRGRRPKRHVAYVEDADDEDEPRVKEESPDKRWDSSPDKGETDRTKRTANVWPEDSDEDVTIRVPPGAIVIKRLEKSPDKWPTVRIKAPEPVPEPEPTRSGSKPSPRWNRPASRSRSGSRSRSRSKPRSGPPSWSSRTDASSSGHGSGWDEDDPDDGASDGAVGERVEDEWADVPRAQVMPRDHKGRPLSFMVQLPKEAPKEPPEHAGSMKFYNDWTPGMGKAWRGYRLDVLNVFGASVANVSDEIKVDVITTDHDERTDFRWLQSVMNLDEFFAFAQSFPGLSDAETGILTQLRDKIRADKSKKMFGGRYIERGTVIRCDSKADIKADSMTDGKSERKTNPGNVSAVFCSFPYLRTRKPTKNAADHDKGYPEMSLLQSMYPFESTDERDSEQTTCTNLEGMGKIVSVPQLWTLSFGQNLLTCAPTSLGNIRSHHLQILSRKESSSFLRYTDRDGQPFCLPFTPDTTLFEIEAAICSDRFDGAAMAGSLSERDRVHLEFDLLPQQENSMLLNVGQKTKYVDVSSAHATPFFAWGSDPGQTWAEKIDSTVKNIETSLRSDVLESSAYAGEPNALMAHFDEPILTDGMRLSHASRFMETLSEVDDGLGLEIDTAVLDGAVNDVDRMMDAMHSIEVLRMSIYRRELTLQLKQTCSSSVDLLHAFLPKINYSKLDATFWGFLTSIVMQAKIHDIPQAPSQTQFKEKWIVRVEPQYVLRHSQVEQTTINSIRKCHRCQSKWPYRTLTEAVDHINGRHADAKGGDVPRSLLLFVHRVSVFKQSETFAAVLSFLTQSSLILSGLLKQAAHIQRGIQAVDSHRGVTDEPIPGWHVEYTFKNFYAFIFALDRSLCHTREIYNKWDARRHARISRGVPRLDRAETLLNTLRILGSNVRADFAAAQRELSGAFEHKIRLRRAPALGLGPESMALWLQTCLVENSLWEQMNAVELYQELYAIVRFKAFHSPRKRLLQRINVLQEELTSLSMVTERQVRCVRNACLVYTPDTYNTPAPRRVFTFRKFEREVVGFALQKLEFNASDFRDLFHRCGPLIDRTKQSVEINEEDHGKAIFVFTVVTVIFLPLTFVTGFLGMNTVDIRNMNKNQDLFWMIALPLTLVTLTLILFVAYSGDGLKERFSRFFSRKRRSQASYASRAMISFSERKEKSGPDLIDMTGSSVAGEPYDRLFSWRARQQPNPLANTYQPPASPVGLPGLVQQSTYGRRIETLPPYELSAQPYPYDQTYPITQDLVPGAPRPSLYDYLSLANPAPAPSRSPERRALPSSVRRQSYDPYAEPSAPPAQRRRQSYDPYADTAAPTARRGGRPSYVEPFSPYAPATAAPPARRPSYYDPANPFAPTPATQHGRPSHYGPFAPAIATQRGPPSYYDPAYPFAPTPATQHGRPSHYGPAFPFNPIAASQALWSAPVEPLYPIYENRLPVTIPQRHYSPHPAYPYLPPAGDRRFPAATYGDPASAYPPQPQPQPARRSAADSSSRRATRQSQATTAGWRSPPRTAPRTGRHRVSTTTTTTAAAAAGPSRGARLTAADLDTYVRLT